MQAPVGGPVVCRYVIFRRLQVDFNVYLTGGGGGGSGGAVLFDDSSNDAQKGSP
jgi:hypothetical protein